MRPTQLGDGFEAYLANVPGAPQAKWDEMARLLAALPDLLYFARGVAGIDESWMDNANERTLRAAIIEFRGEARAILDKLAEHSTQNG